MEVRDVVAGVTRGVGDPKALDPLSAAESDDVLGRHRHNLAPEALHVVAVEAGGAREQLRRLHQMRRPDLVHEDAQLRELIDQRARCAGVVEVNVRQEQRLRLVLEARQQGLQAGRGARIDDQAVQLVGADHAVAPQVHAVDQLRHIVELPPVRT